MYYESIKVLDCTIRDGGPRLAPGVPVCYDNGSNTT